MATKLVVEIDLDNEWFRHIDDGSLLGDMVAMSLSDVGKCFERGDGDGTVTDGNGNTCGTFRTVTDDLDLTEEDEDLIADLGYGGAL